MTVAEYRADKRLSYSTLTAYLKSPEHFRRLVTGQWQVPETDAMRLGTAIHAHIQGFAAFAPGVVGANRATKDGKEAAAQAEAEGKIVLTPTAYAAYEAITDNYGAVQPWVDMVQLDTTTRETPLMFELADNGGHVHQLKGMYDAFCPGPGNLIDIKCTGLELPRFIRRVQEQICMQLALYRDGLRQSGQAVNRVEVLRIDTTPPYVHGICLLTESTLHDGLQKARDILTEIRACAETHGYDNPWPVDCYAAGPIITI